MTADHGTCDVLYAISSDKVLGGCPEPAVMLATWRDGHSDQKLCKHHASMAINAPEIRTLTDL